MMNVFVLATVFLLPTACANLELFIRDAILRETHAQANGDILVNSVILLCNEVHFTYCKGFQKYLGSRNTLLSVLSDMENFPLDVDTEQHLFVVMSPEVFLKSPWIIQYSEKNIWYIPKEVQGYIPRDKLRLTSMVYTYCHSSPGAFEIYDVYAVKQRPIVRSLGTWNISTGFNFQYVYIWERRKDMSGILIETVVESNPPSSNITVDKHGKVLSAEGMFPDIFYLLHDKMNFSYSMTISEDRQWGSRTNGTWNGKS